MIIDPRSPTWLAVEKHIVERMENLNKLLLSETSGHKATVQARARYRELQALLLSAAPVEAPLIDSTDYNLPE